MFKNPLVRLAFHLGWFLLILGGASLIEERMWQIPGMLIFTYGILFFIYTASAFYLNKVFYKQPAHLLLATIIGITTVIIAHLIFKHTLLSGIMTLLTLPIVISFFMLRGNDKPAAKKKG